MGYQQKLERVGTWCGTEATKTLLTSLTRASTLEANEEGYHALDGKGRILMDTGPSPQYQIPAIIPISVSRHNSIAGSGYAQMLLRTLTCQVSKQWDDILSGEPNTVTIYGGWAALAKTMGYSSRKAAIKLRETANTLRHVYVDGPLGRGGILDYYEIKATKGQQAIVRFYLMGLMDPDIVNLLTKRRGKIKYLVPVPEHLPPRSCHDRFWGAELALQQRVLVLMRERARDLYERGGITISDVDWRQMANESGLKPKDMDKVVKGYLVGDDLAPPFMVLNGDLWTLTDTYCGSRDCLTRGGGRMASGARSARKPRFPRRKVQ